MNLLFIIIGLAIMPIIVYLFLVAALYFKGKGKPRNFEDI